MVEHYTPHPEVLGMNTLTPVCDLEQDTLSPHWLIPRNSRVLILFQYDCKIVDKDIEPQTKETTQLSHY